LRERKDWSSRTDALSFQKSFVREVMPKCFLAAALLIASTWASLTARAPLFSGRCDGRRHRVPRF